MPGPPAPSPQRRGEVLDRLHRPVELREVTPDALDLVGIARTSGAHGVTTEERLGPRASLGRDVLAHELKAVEGGPVFGDDGVEWLVPAERMRGDDGGTMGTHDAQ